MNRIVAALRRVLPAAALSSVAALLPVAPLSPVAAPTAGALAIPTNPTNPAVAEQWANPGARQDGGPHRTEPARVELLSGPESVAAHDPVNVTLRVTNTTTSTLDGLRITPRRGPAVGSTHDQRAAAVADLNEYTVVGRSRDVDKPLAPGESTEITFEILEDELPLPDMATYPLAFVLDAGGEVLDTERFHLTVRGAADRAEGEREPGLSTLFPVSAPVDIVPGETGQAPDDGPLILSSEQLSAQLSAGGRLDQLLDVYQAATTDPGVAAATCMSLDPALVDTVARMADGYTVARSRPDVVEQPKRLRDSWGSATQESDPGVTGTGAADARAWLDRLRDIAATHCIIAMPWANADLNAVARTGDVWLMREAVERGPVTLKKHLGTGGVGNVVLPGAGYLDEGVAAGLGWADHARSTVAAEGLNGAWEKAQTSVGKGESGRVKGEARTTLDRQDLPGATGVTAPPPSTPVRVLVASGTLVHDGTSGRFAALAPGVTAVEYQSELSSTLAAVGPHPETTGYSDETFRYELDDDSPRARAINAASAIRVAARSARAAETADTGDTGDTGDTTNIAEPEAAPEPLLVNPPAGWDAASAATVMGAVADTLATTARPMALEEYTAAPAEGLAPATAAGSPFSDPSTYADSEILAAGQQARFANDLSALLVADPAIALGRYGFTLPLRRDLLMALSTTGRRARDAYVRSEQDTSARLAGSRDVLNKLRSSVTLIPPGNVYTRVSPSSPLLIVAQNGLPLPVDAKILYTGPEGAGLHVPNDLRIPAHGSVTVQMTADLPDARDTDLQLFLASPQGVPISQPVDIRVRTSGIAMRGWVVLASLGAALALLALVRMLRRRRPRGPDKALPRPRPQPQPQHSTDRTTSPAPPGSGATRMEKPSP